MYILCIYAYACTRRGCTRMKSGAAQAAPAAPFLPAVDCICSSLWEIVYYSDTCIVYLTVRATLLRIFHACANSGAQAVLSSPAKKRKIYILATLPPYIYTFLLLGNAWFLQSDWSAVSQGARSQMNCYI